MLKFAEEHLELSEFSKFCSEFKIGLKRPVITELFKKTTDPSHKMTLDEFIIILQKLSVEINNDKKKFIEERIKVLEKKLEERRKEDLDHNLCTHCYEYGLLKYEGNKRTYNGKIVTEHLYVGKKMINDFPTYSHIIKWNEDEKKWMLRT